MDYAPLKKQFDSSDMSSRIDEFLSEFQKAFDMGFAAQVADTYKSAQHVYGVGMGGSAMGFKLLQGLAKEYNGLPITLVADYDIPHFVKPENSVVFVTSFSGNTEESLSAVQQAVNRNIPVVCVTSGGKLAEFAKSHAIPHVTFSYPVQPRVGLPYTFGITLGIFTQLGYLSLTKEDVAKAVAEVAPLQEMWKLQSVDNEAMKIAETLKGKLAYVVGGGVSESVAIRWKGQLNENSKTIAFTEPMPEMCHNMVLGYVYPEMIRTNSAIVFLTSSHDHAQNSKRVAILDQMLAPTGVTIVRPKTPTLSYFGTMLAQVLLGDYCSYYLALLNNVDPVDTSRIAELKKQLES